MPEASQPPGFHFDFHRRTQAVRRAVDILKLFSLAEPELSLHDVSARLALAPPTAHRLLQTLEEEGLLARINGTDLYRLGPLVPTLAAHAMAQYPVRRIAAPYLRRLAHELGQTVALSRYEDGSVVYLDCVQGPHPVALVLQPGARIPAHCVASGRAMLAHLGELDIQHLIERGLHPCSPRSIVEARALRRQLETIRRQGYAMDDGDWVQGVRAGAAAILDAEDRPVAAMTAIGFASELSTDDVRQLAIAVAAAAREVATQLGAPRTAG